MGHGRVQKSAWGILLLPWAIASKSPFWDFTRLCL
jgi:hypothetical protein